MASTEGVNIVISGDSSQAEKAIKDVSSAIDGIKDSSVKITADASQAIGEAEKLASTVENINDAHAEITANSSQAVGEANKASSAMENVNDAHAEITADGSQAVDEAGKVANAEESIKDAHSTITADGSQAISELERLEELMFGIDRKKVEFQVKTVIRDEQGRLRDMSGKFLKMGKQVGESFASGTASGLARIEKSVNSILINKVGGQISSFFKSILNGIASTAKKAAGIVAGAMKSALAIGGGFEAQITNVKVVSGATEKELDKLIKKAREMGATLPISAQDSATAMLLLAQRGMQAEDILTVVSEVANLAISQSTDMATATDLLGSIMTNFNMKVEEAAKIIDMLNNASNQSPLTMQKMTEAFKYVGPAAGAMGMQLSEALSMMEAAIRAVGSGEMAGTGIAMTLTKLASESHILGVRTKELNGQFRPMAAIFSELKEKGLGLAEANKIFGARAGKTALALINLSDNLKEWETNLKKTGSTQDAVNAKSKTFTNTMAALRSAIEELHIEIFDQIKKQSKEAVGGITELTRAFSKWVGETQIAGKSLNAFLDGLGFNIPSGSDFQKLLQQFDVQAFVNRIKELGSTLKSIGESIANAFSTIKTPLLWLIEHLDTFATISFWGWILGKGLQVPAAILSIASSIKILGGSFEFLSALNLAKAVALVKTIGFLAVGNPIGLAAVGTATIGATYFSIIKDREKLRKAMHEEEKRYLSEQAEADLDLSLDIKTNFKTGFEKLPESWTKASDEVRKETNDFVKELQEQFRVKVAAALDYVARKFPELADAIKDMGTVSNSTLRQITAALQGDEKAFEALPEHLKKVTEHLNAVDAGLVRYGVDLYGITQKYREFRKEVEKPAQRDESAVFLEEMAASIKSIMTDLPAEIERANKFLSGSNGQLAVQVSLTQAEKKLDAFVKTASEKYSLPEDIVKESTIKRLNDLAQAGNATAQSLINGWNSAGNALDTFLSDAKDAINYLGASPENFIPALNKLMNGIQKLDPITGKVTESFKKAHDALKQWSKITFDSLMNRIGKLRKATEGGFINKSYLEEEVMNAAPKIKLQIVKELEPMREQFGSEKEYLAVVASEFLTKIEEVAGDFGVNLMSRIYDGMSGAAIGASILADVKKQLGVEEATTASIKINHAEIVPNHVNTVQEKYSGLGEALKKLDNLPQNTSNAVNRSTGNTPNAEINYSNQVSQIVTEIKNLFSGIQGVTTAVNNGVNSLISTVVSVSTTSTTGSEAVAFNNYPAEIASVIREIQLLSGNIEVLNKSTVDNTSAMAQLQGSFTSTNNGAVSQNNSNDCTPLTTAVQNLSTAVNALQAVQQANSSAIGEVISAVRSVENAVKSINVNNNYDIDINQQGFMIEKKSDADILARSTVNALRAGIGNGGM